MAVFSDLELVYPVGGLKTITATMSDGVARVNSESIDFLALLVEILNKIVNLPSFDLMDRFGISAAGGKLVPDEPKAWKFPTIQSIDQPPESGPWYELKDAGPPPLALLTAGNTTVAGINVRYIPGKPLLVSAWKLNELAPELTTNQPPWKLYPQLFNKILSHYCFLKANPSAQNPINVQVDGTTITWWDPPHGAVPKGGTADEPTKLGG